MSLLEKPQNRIGFDLDRTLAKFKLEQGDLYDPTVIGEPIPRMVNVAKEHMRRGDVVVIFTARVHPDHGEEAVLSERAIKDWCLNVFGCELEVTCMKDPQMKRIYDDRAVSVEPNTGNITTFVFDDDDDDDGDDLPESPESPDSLGSLIGS